MTPPVALTIAGTDSGGAAGIAADLTTFSLLGVHGACVVTAVTAQDTTGVREIHPVPADVVSAQISAVLDDLPVAVVKTGMLGSAEVVGQAADRLGHLPLVVDPVLVATSGAVLGGEEVAAAYVERLLPVATVITPNLAEARALLDSDGKAAELAQELAGHGCGVVITGGPEWRPGDAVSTCTDWVCLPGHDPQAIVHPALATTNDHGSGCTYSAALAGSLAQAHGPHAPADGAARPVRLTPDALVSACRQAAEVTTRQLTLSTTWHLGRGRGPIAHTQPHKEI